MMATTMMKPATRSSALNPHFDITLAWQQCQAGLQRMTVAQKRQTLVDAGILMKSGRVAKPYRGVIVSA